MSKYRKCFNRTVSAVVLAVMFMLIIAPQNLANDIDELSETENIEVGSVETEEESKRTLLLPEEIEEQSDETEEEPERTLLLPEELERLENETEEETEEFFEEPEEFFEETEEFFEEPEEFFEETEEFFKEPEEFFEETEEFFEEPEEFFEEPLANMLFDLTYMEETPYSLDDYSQYSGTNWTNKVVITYWDIRYWVDGSSYYSLSDSENYSAIPNAKYQLVFKWELNVSDTSPNTLQEGDYFILKFPENEVNGWWSALDTGWSDLSDGNGEKCGEWMICTAADGKKEIHVVFGEAVNGQYAITGIEMSTGKDALTNLNMRKCIQSVSFGEGTATNVSIIKKTIAFKQHEIGLLQHGDYKQFVYSSNRNILWQIGVGAATTSELTGFWEGIFDRIEHDRTQPYEYGGPITYEWTYLWGKGDPYKDGTVYHYQDTIVEDQLEKGVTVDAIYIAARTMVPMEFTDDQYLYDFYRIRLVESYSGRGGPASWQPAFTSYVLAHYDGMPHYRDDQQELYGILMPIKNDISGNTTSFTLVEQDGGESYEDFKKRLKPYQYGIYSDGGTPATLTVVINFGNIGTTIDNNQPKYSALATDFVERSVDACINNGYYNNIDEDMLTEYFSEVYGDNNIIGGRVANYMIDLHVTYPPNTPNENGDGTKKNGDGYNGNIKMTWTNRENVGNIKYYSAEGKLNYLTGLVSLASNTARLTKYDVDTNESLQGVKFKLQQLVGLNTWSDYGENIQTTDENGIVEWTNLPEGEYRFVEVEPLPNYDIVHSEGYDPSLGTCVSEQFSINGQSAGKYIFLSNKQFTGQEPPGLTFSFIKADQFGNPIHGAEFMLYSCNSEHSNNEHSNTGLVDGSCWSNPIFKKSDENGEVRYFPLYAGDYLLVETYTPEPYILPVGQWFIELESFTTITPVAINGTSPPNFSYNEIIRSFWLTNYQPINLPETGGKGTPAFGIAGTVMTGASGGILLYIKRKRKK